MGYAEGEKFHGRLVAYLPDGPRLGPLSHPVSWRLSVPFNDVGSLELVYHPKAPNADLLQFYGGEVAVEVRGLDSNSWFEPPGCRFLVLRRHEDPASREEAYRYTMPNYSWLLRKVRQIDLSKFNSDGVRPYPVDTPPRMMKDILTEAQARSNIPGLDHSTFAPLIASDGSAWLAPVTMNFEMGQDALSMMDAFARQRLIDWNMFGRSLRIYNPNTYLTQDRTATVKLFDKYDAVASPLDFTYEDMATRLLNQGDGGAVVVEVDAKPFSPWGAWEEASTATGVNSTAELSRLAQNDLAAKYDYKTEYVKDLLFRQNSPRPFLEYGPGELIQTSQSTAARVQQITLMCDGPHRPLRGSVTLSNHPDVNRMVPRELRQQRWINSLVGGAGVGGPTAAGGNGMIITSRTAPAPPAPSTPQPSTVLSVTGANESAFDTLGRPQAVLRVNWAAVTTDTSGAPLTPAYYQIVGWSTAFPTERPMIQEVSTPLTTARIVVPEASTYSFVVRAVSQQGVTGSYSSPSTAAVAFPTTTPPTPSAPILVTLSNQVRISWDGLDSTAAVPPAQVEFYCVERSLTSASTGFVEVGTIAAYGGGRDGRMMDNSNTGTVIWYRARFRDRAGNLGPYSSVTSITVTSPASSIAVNSLNANVLQDGTVTATQIGDGQVGAAEVGTYAIFDYHLVHGRGERNLLRDPNFGTSLNTPRVTVSNLAVNTNARCLWAVASPLGSGVTSALGAGGEYDARMVMVPNSLWTDAQPSSGSQALPSPDHAFQLDPDYGPLRGGFRLSAQSATWPAAGQGISVFLVVRYYTFDGTNMGGSAVNVVSISNINANTAAPYVIVKTPTAGVTVPADASWGVAYLRIGSTGMSGRAGVQVTIGRPFLMQSYSAL